MCSIDLDYNRSITLYISIHHLLYAALCFVLESHYYCEWLIL